MIPIGLVMWGLPMMGVAWLLDRWVAHGNTGPGMYWAIAILAVVAASGLALPQLSSRQASLAQAIGVFVAVAALPAVLGIVVVAPLAADDSPKAPAMVQRRAPDLRTPPTQGDSGTVPDPAMEPDTAPESPSAGDVVNDYGYLICDRLAAGESPMEVAAELAATGEVDEYEAAAIVGATVASQCPDLG